MFVDYHSTLWAIWLIITTVVVQGLIASIAHRKQKHYVPGVLDAGLGHESFVFRSHRTHQNSLDNVFLMVVPALLAMFLEVNATSLSVVVWIYAVARLIHMQLYYFIATEKNPSPRSYFYIIGFLANLYLLGMVANKLLG